MNIYIHSFLILCVFQTAISHHQPHDGHLHDHQHYREGGFKAKQRKLIKIKEKQYSKDILIKEATHIEDNGDDAPSKHQVSQSAHHSGVDYHVSEGHHTGRLHSACVSPQPQPTMEHLEEVSSFRRNF